MNQTDGSLPSRNMPDSVNFSSWTPARGRTEAAADWPAKPDLDGHSSSA
jgi:hypothetical protein